MKKAVAQIHLRACNDDKRLLMRAARATGRRKLTDYILSTMLERARVDLADHPKFSLHDREFQRFLARLDEPPRFLPGLHALMSRPSIFEAAPVDGIHDRTPVASSPS